MVGPGIIRSQHKGAFGVLNGGFQLTLASQYRSQLQMAVGIVRMLHEILIYQLYGFINRPLVSAVTAKSRTTARL